ncbi:MAG: hypothetical protein HKP55_11090 [Gammaproteobacteria bacterium]|nr:hypothetical protein [Gammaproteobacteria bacterium]NNJ92212.1 hypothetical protein [Gammaproteobacteria bacterium]
MLDHKIRQYITINVTGRVFVLCTKEGVKSTSQIRKYEKQVRDFLEEKANEGADIKSLEQLTAKRLELLRQEINGQLPEQPLEEAEKPKQTAPQKQQVAKVVEESEKNIVSKPAQSRKTISKPAVASKKPAEVASYQDKLSFHRKPVVELLKKECVDFHLLTPDRAKYWVHHLSGRFIEDVEPDIVSELSDTLLKNVRTYMRKNKKQHPWQSPMVREQLRKDIAAKKTIKGILTLTSQILWEIRQSSQEANSGLLGRIKSKLSW